VTAEPGLIRAGGVVVISGTALHAAHQCAVIAIRHRNLSGLPTQPYEALACELRAAMAAAGHSDVRFAAVSDPVLVEEPTVPLHEAAARLGISLRQARRLALRLGGRKIAGRWFVDETALREHIEGRRQ
jgi:hypothetical protein